VLPAVTLISNYTGLDFGNSGSAIPPDPTGAAGGSCYLETVNRTLALYTPKATGTNVVTDSFLDFWFLQGQLPRTDTGSRYAEPVSVWDDQVQRFITGVEDIDVLTHRSNFDLAVSKSASPTTFRSADWNFYQINTSETSVDASYPGNFGFNHDAFVFTFDMLGVDIHVQAVSVAISDLVAGHPITPFHNDLLSADLRPTVMHDSRAGDPMWFVAEHGDAASIDVYKMTNVLSNSAVFTRTNLAVNQYVDIGFVPPKQPDGTNVADIIDSRILKAAESNNTIVVAHAISVSQTEDAARWYAIDVSSGTPVLEDQGNVTAGNNTYIYYPAIDINSNGDIGMSFMQSGTGQGQFMSVYVTGRIPSDSPGTMETPVLVQAGVQNYHDSNGAGNQRVGELTGISVDSDGSFWVVSQYADFELPFPNGGADWGTAIANFSVGIPPTPTDLAVNLSASTTSPEGANLVYSVTITNNGPAEAANVALTDVLPSGTTFVSASFSQGSFNVTSGVLTLTVPALAVSSSITGTITLLPLEEGSLTDTVNVSANNPDPNPGNNQSSATTTLSDPAVVPSAQTISAVEGSSQDVVVATFTDPGGPESISDYSANIDWGDGHTSMGTITFDSGSGTFSLHGSSPYVEEGTKSVNVTIHHDTAPNALVTSSAQITDPSVLPTGGFAVSGTEGTDTGAQTVATFTDPGGAEPLADYSASINWGDGHTSAGAITLSGSTFTVKGNNTYGEEGTYTITVTIHHDAAPDATTVSSASIADPSVLATGGLQLSGSEGLSTGPITLATFTDSGGAEQLSEYTATINWGDGSTSPGTITFSSSTGTFTVGGTHVFQSEGSLPIMVTIHHGTALDAAASDSANVGDPAVIPTAQSVAAEEGVLTDLVVATFTDPGGSEPLSDYSASIAWGDGQTSSGTITFDSTSGVFSVHGMHAYAQEGIQTTINVTIHHDTAPDATVMSSANVSDSPVTATGAFTIHSTEAANTGIQTVATFTDPGGAEALTDYSANINWGDGHTSSGSITFSASVFTVTGSNSYTEEGNYTVAVTIHHDSAPDAMTTSTAQVSDPPVTLTGGFQVTGTEGSNTGTVTLATFTDPAGAEPLSEYSATVNWGDNTTSSGSIAFNSGTGVFNVSGSHVFQGDGALTITVTLHHGTATDATAADSAQVNDPSVGATGGFAFNASEGIASGPQTVATFTDPGGPEPLSNYSATINWGDSSTSSGSISFNSTTSVFTVSGAHAYPEEGSSSITVTIHHGQATDQSVTSNAVIVDAPLNATGGFTVMGTEAASTASQTVATFTDPGGAEALADYAATIDWGDSSASSGAISFAAGVFRVSGSHLYAEEGTYAIHVTIHHDSATNVVATSSANVADIPVVATGGFAFSAVEGVAAAAQTVATFTDPAGISSHSTYSANINWGDTTSSTGQITQSAGVFTVSGSHSYTEEGSYTITVTIHHDTATDVSVTSSSSVADQGVTATGLFNITAVEGTSSASQTVATFADPAGAEAVANYSAQIDWGDHATSTGTITFDSATQAFSVSGSHAYAEEGTDTITVTITHETEASDVVTSSATVADAALSFNRNAGLTVNEGATFSGAVATFTDGTPNAPVSDFSATIQWGDGTSSNGSISVAGGQITVSGSHVYPEDATDTISVSIRDVGGTQASGQVAITIAEPSTNATPVFIGGFEFSPLNNTTLITFTHGGGQEPPAAFTASINWGDGTTAAGTVIQVAAVYAVLGSHTYMDEGTYSIAVTVSEDSGSTTFQTTAMMLEELLPGGSRGTADQRWLGETYRTLLGRPIETVGLQNDTAALAAGVSRTQIVQGIEGSTEYLAKFANSLFFSLLGRQIDPAGLNMSLQVLTGNAGLGNGPHVEQLKAIIIGSPEYFAKHGSSNTSFLEAVYHDVLGRAIDPGGLTNWSALLAAGTSRSSEALLILTSPEAYGVLTESDYRLYLHRDVDPGSLVAWVQALSTGLRDEDLVAGLVASDEFFARTIP
jgi:uncharacterized repeat protein (TIGR01451 family)